MHVHSIWHLGVFVFPSPYCFRDWFVRGPLRLRCLQFLWRWGVVRCLVLTMAGISNSFLKALLAVGLSALVSFLLWSVFIGRIGWFDALGYIWDVFFFFYMFHLVINRSWFIHVEIYKWRYILAAHLPVESFTWPWDLHFTPLNNSRTIDPFRYVAPNHTPRNARDAR